MREYELEAFDVRGMVMLRNVVCLVLFAALAAPLAADKTKTVSGKARVVEEKRLVVKKKGWVRESLMEFELTKDTKKTGQLAPGVHVKVKYREEKAEDGSIRRIALDVEARPEFASKEAKKLAKEQKTKP